MNADDEAQATSLAFSILNFQVIISLPVGLESESLISSADLIITVSSLASAFAHLSS